jgi:N6-L-threonylcarbamoyladenine synthase
MKAAAISYSDLTCISVCHGPGLIGSLLVGCSFAKAVCYAKQIPLVAVNHLEGHIFSTFLEERRPDYPFIALIVSGGHTCLFRVEGFGKYFELGRTRDDAAGEAYDKVSKLLGLGYPGGPVIDVLARTGNPEAIDFPRAYLPESLDFSFSGLKTAVLNYVKSEISSSNYFSPFRGEGKGEGEISPLINDISASFQAAVVDVLIRKTEWAVRKERIKRVALSGGVAANSSLRKRMQQMADEREAELFMPSLSLCTDNAAMIAAAGYHHFKAGNLAGLDLNPVAYLPL